MATVAGKSRVVPARLRARPAPWAPSTMLVAVLYVSAIGLQPLQDRGAAFAQYAVVDQRLYMPLYLALALVAVATWWLRPAYPARLFDPWLVAFLCWSGFTVLVSPVPAKALLGWGKQVAYFLGVAALVVTCRTQRRLVHVLGWTLLAFVVADVAAVLLRPDVAIHHASDAVEPTLAGLWRGLHPHKAKFGELLAFAVLLLPAIARGRWRWLRVLALPLVALMLLAGAKTSLLALASSLLLLAGLRVAARYAPGTLVTIVAAPLIVLLAVAGGLLLPILLVDVFGDATLAGRTHLWDVLWRYAGAHALFGSGYASFFLGEDGPLFRTGDPMLMRMGNAHNSFLDLLVTTGWPGAVLGHVALLLAPVAAAYRRLPHDRFARLWVSVILFGGISSLTSVTLLQNERASGLLLTIAYLALRQFLPGGYAVPPIGARWRRHHHAAAGA
ncbi:O-antigen ligase family protein [Sphingomonas sp.]|uniref:O-antigen ligase family protein n=1 Tax=Sphingomonas sp. TaxID=28214 RepID=UPI0035C877E2